MALASQSSVQVVHNAGGRGWLLEASQVLPRPREAVYEFFSNASNLQELTPPWLHFSVVTPSPIQIGAGTLIDYRLRIHGIPLRWQSRISVWEPPGRFVDEQVRGPYRRWRHEHRFEAIGGETLCRDRVEYEVRGGALVHALFVRRDLLTIFTFRHQKLGELFPPTATGLAEASAADAP